MKKKLLTCSVGAILGLIASFHPGELKTSQRGLEHIANWEACIYCTYKDSVGVDTIGLGATRWLDGKTPAPGQVATDRQVAELYVRDIKVNEQCVKDRLNGNKMPQSVFDASVSMVHNNGCSGTTWNPRTQKMTQLRANALAGNWVGVCDRMMDFVNAGGKFSKGVYNRRFADRALCMEDLK